jgi:NitT/TauT family transport system substrate-binding protein
MGTTEANAKGRRKISRRTLLRGAGAAGVAAAAIGVGGRPLMNYAVAGNAPKLRLAWTEVAACHSPLGFGLAKGFYAKHGLDVELFFQGASGQTLIQAIATGTS